MEKKKYYQPKVNIIKANFGPLLQLSGIGQGEDNEDAGAKSTFFDNSEETIERIEE